MRASLAIVLLLTTSLAALADTKSVDSENPFLRKHHFPIAYLLLPDSLPLLRMAYLKKGGRDSVGLTDKQKTLIDEKLGGLMEKAVEAAHEAQKLETDVMRDVVFDGKSGDDVTAKLEKIAKLRLEFTKIQISCLNFFKKTLDKAQYEKMLALVKVASSK